MVKIAIDGNIGCGKSTVIEKFRELKYKVYSEDIESWGDWLEKYYEDGAGLNEKIKLAKLMTELVFS